MLIELISFLGTSVGGALFGQVSKLIQAKHERLDDEREHKFKVKLARAGALKEYMDSVYAQKPDGSYSPLAYASVFMLSLLAATYCATTAWCFFYNGEQLIFTKDPTDDARQISLFFGAIKWDLANNRILSMSRIGVGFSMCYPIIFILSSVLQGEKTPRGSR